MSELIRLATKLRGLSAQQLSDVLVTGKYLENPPHDLFELARSLLTRRQLEPKIRKLSAADLEKLRSGKSSKVLVSLNLADEKSAYDSAVAVSELLEPAKNKRPEFPERGLEKTALASYETLLAITEAIFASERHWLKYMKSGLRAPDAKWISDRVQLTPKEIQDRFNLARVAGLITEENDRWLYTQDAEAWLQLDAANRWQVLVKNILDLPFDYKPKAAADLFSDLRENYPLLDLAEINFLNFGSALSLLDGGVLTGLGEQALKSLDKAAIALAKSLPAPANKLIVQADLTITSPGPLSVELHRELDFFAESEDLGIAARFRLSTLSLTHALESGRSISEIENLLTKLSGKELPQPVVYLFNEVTGKLGHLVIRSEPQGSIIEAKDPILLLQIANEAALTPLGFKKISETNLFSLADVEVVYFNLREAGYPAIIKNAAGEIVNPRHPAIRTAGPLQIDALEASEKLLKSEAVEAAGDEKLRQLQFAMKNKMRVFIKIEMPDGTKTDLELEPLGIAGNRLRGRDVVKQAERTLPLSAIRSIQLG